jgi:hypothetical protein
MDHHVTAAHHDNTLGGHGNIAGSTGGDPVNSSSYFTVPLERGVNCRAIEISAACRIGRDCQWDIGIDLLQPR